MTWDSASASCYSSQSNRPGILPPISGLTSFRFFCHAQRVTDSRHDFAVRLQRPPTETMQRFGSMVVLVGGMALAGAFIPGVTLAALILAVIGLVLGIVGSVMAKAAQTSSEANRNG